MKVKVFTREGYKEVTAYRTATPGLAVHKSLDRGWTVTCIDIGFSLCNSRGMPTKKAAMLYAEGLGKLAAWEFAFVPKDLTDQAKIELAFNQANPKTTFRKVGKKVLKLRASILEDA